MFELFPAHVRGPNIDLDRVKVFITPTQAVVFDRRLQRVLEVNLTSYSMASVDQPTTILNASSGDTYEVLGSKGCGCGSRLKGFTAEKAGLL